MQWLIIRLRARRINQIRRSRLRTKFMQHCRPSEDNEQQADLCAQFEMKRRRITAHDIQFVRQMKHYGIEDELLEVVKCELESTRVARISGIKI